MRYLNTLASYVPSIIVKHCLEDQTEKLPNTQTYVTVCVFCDVSGFTKLSEAMAQSGRCAEGLKTHLNSYFSQMNKIISGNGGDIFKFAGDAMIVLWPPSDDLGDLARRATQCAIEIQRALDQSHAEVARMMTCVVEIAGACGGIDAVPRRRSTEEARESGVEDHSGTSADGREAGRRPRRARASRSSPSSRCPPRTTPPAGREVGGRACMRLACTEDSKT